MTDISIPLPNLSQDIKLVSVFPIPCSLEINQKIMNNIATKTTIASNAAVNIITMKISFQHFINFDFDFYYNETIKSSVLRGLYGN